VKQRLPTLAGKASGARRERERSRKSAEEFAGRPTERPVLSERVVAIAHVNQPEASSKLAAQLCAALTRAGSAVAALVSVDSSALTAESQAAFAALMESGARQAKLVRITEPAQAAGALHTAVAEIAPGSDWIVAWGNALPQLFQPFFTVVVTGHRRELTHADPLVLQAQLEVTAPTEELATLLARKLSGSEQA
jgi:hypothetical protein